MIFSEMKNLKGWGYEPSESLGEFFFFNPDVVLIFHLKTQVFEGDTDIENRLMDTGEGKERVGRMEKVEWKHMHYHKWNR